MGAKVPVGVSTVVGYLTALAGFAAAVAAYKQGDRSDATLGTIAGGAVGVISLVTTAVGRFAQAHKTAGVHVEVELPESELEVIAEHVNREIDRRLDPFAAEIDEGPGEDAPPEAALHPLADPAGIPADEGDAGSKGAVVA